MSEESFPGIKRFLSTTFTRSVTGTFIQAGRKSDASEAGGRAVVVKTLHFLLSQLVSHMKTM